MANFSYGTFLKLVLERVAAKSQLLPLVNTNADFAAAGADLGEVVRVYVDPLSGVQVRTYTDVPIGTERPDFVFDRLVRNFIPVSIDQLIYAGFVANGLDTIDFAEEAGRNYANFISQIADVIAADIDNRLATSMNSITATTVAVEEGTRGETALATLAGVETAIDDLIGIGVSGVVGVAHPSVTRRLGPVIESYSFTGDSKNVALRDGIVGSVYGSLIVKSAKISPNSIVLFSRDAFAAVTRAAGKSSGAKESASIRNEYLALTANLAFDTRKQADVVAVSAIAKVATLDAARARKVTFTYA